ncbi:hypothetical protein [Niallia alba]|uniref:hypothetical protein n=1 Tax=Niallia alba TaxID=2729105 RepID=UPI0039A32BB4
MLRFILKKQMFILTELVVKLARVYYGCQEFIRDLHNRNNDFNDKRETRIPSGMSLICEIDMFIHPNQSLIAI